MATDRAARGAPRIAISLQGDPTDPAAWSGVPASISAGLEAAGCAVVPISAKFPQADRVARVLGMSWAEQATSRRFAAACGAAASRQLAKAEPLDGIVMLGSGYSLSTQIPIVTFDDMTLALALRQSAPPYDSLSETGKKTWLERQRQVYERSRGVCVASTWAANSAREDYGVVAAKVHVVGTGHNLDVGRPQRDWSQPRFLFVGADWERKRGEAVVAAFAAVRQRHPDATLDLVGAHPSVDAEGVTGHGPLPLNSAAGRQKYGELLRLSTCFLMPSTYEPFGIAYIDAAAAGVASIGTTVGGAPDAVGDGGRVVDPHDEDALLTAMLELCDPETARQLGERAYQRSKLLTWQAVAERLLRALRPSGLDLEALAGDLTPVPAEAG
jgi:Glycosyl transferases group 1